MVTTNIRIKTNTTISENQKIKYIKGIVNGIIHIHSLGFIHRDLATRNVLLNNNIPKISDFGSVIKENEATMELGSISPLWTHPTALKSKKFLAYLLADLGWKIIILYMR